MTTTAKGVPGAATKAEALSAYRWLVSSEAADWLADLATRQEPLLTATTRLRKRLSPTQTHLLLEQVALRRKGREKFSAAERMFFTPLGLEQATDEFVATYKAARFPQRQPIADLCCGIGGDLLPLAARGEVTGVDRDPIKSLLTAANSRAMGHATGLDDERGMSLRVRIRSTDVASIDVTDFAAWHLDPDRRPRGERTTRIDEHEPNRESVERLLGANGNAAIKLAPAAELPDAWRERAEWEWISRGGECRQLVAWFGSLARQPGVVRATILASGSEPASVVEGTRGLPVPLAAKMGRYLLEPDAAVLAADLVGALAEQHGLAAISPGIAYLTGDAPCDDRALACFEVTAVLPYQPRRLRALLRSRGLGRLEVKKRGVPYDPDQLRRQLQVPGDEAATLIVTRLDHAVTAILAQRVERKTG